MQQRLDRVLVNIYLDPTVFAKQPNHIYKLSVLVVSWIEKFLTNRKQPHVMTHFLCSNVGGVFECISYFSVSYFSSVV